MNIKDKLTKEAKKTGKDTVSLILCLKMLDKQKAEILKMIKFDKEDLPAFPPIKMMEKLRTPDGLLEFALMIIKANINHKLK